MKLAVPRCRSSFQLLSWRSLAVIIISLLVSVSPIDAAVFGWTLVGWNNLGMHCMDADYAVFSLLPPYNTIHAQLIDPNGALVTDPGQITVTYEGIADPDGSINTTSNDKTNFWDFVQALFGAAPPIDTGLKNAAMPGIANTPQPMVFDTGAHWFIAEGIPITPYDNSLRKNPYPLMHLVARDGSGTELATTDIVLPVSDEMNCAACHASGSNPAAQPALGWVFDSNPQRDFRLNILRVHDQLQTFSPKYPTVLAALGYNAAGLYATVTTDGKPILCAACHASEALGTGGQPGIPPLTRSVHGWHALMVDPSTGMTLDASENRSACYRCHPGSTTKCLRGAMGAAVAADGTLAIQCQSCHGKMSALADASRTGWLDEPACQQCHTGTATHNNGEIRYTSALDANGQPRQAVDATYATTADVPAAGYTLYRFSSGHGGITCEGCHGSTHAEFPSAHRNDNIQSVQHQGHVGMLVECGACHPTVPQTISGGPHGMHPVGQSWVQAHGETIGDGEGGAGTAGCQDCHGQDYRGTVLSRAQGERTLHGEDIGTKTLWRGFQIGCYTCHLGPGNSNPNPNRAPAAQDAAVTTSANTPVTTQLTATDSDGDVLTLRIVSQPAHGTVGLDTVSATYIPDPDFAGSDTFTFAAWDGSTDSNLASVAVTVNAAPPTPTPGPSCAADCNGDGVITVADLVHGVNMALGTMPLSGCASFDMNGDGVVSVAELIRAVNALLAGTC